MLFTLWGFFLINALLMIISLWRNRKKPEGKINYIDRLVLFLFAFSGLLIIIPEFFYIKDIYPGHFRANTMFKMGYQAFILSGIASAIVLGRIGYGSPKFARGLRSIYLVFFSFIAMYPLLSFPSYYGGLKDNMFLTRPPELDGRKWLRNTYPHDMEIVEYILRNIPGDRVILEAQGDSYTDHNRISAYTGNPTVAGWWVHQWLWRGSPDVVSVRIPDIEALYQSESVDVRRAAADKYNVEYIVVSDLEREKYPEINTDVLDEMAVKVFQSKNGFGALYKVLR
jgi:uncharacterized membrane protein